MTENNFINKQIFYINSHNKQEGTDSDFTYKINIDPDNKYDRVALLDCSIPKSYYLIQSGRNTFTLIEGINTITITLTAGNYTRLSLKTTLQTILNSSTMSSFIYTVTYSSSPSYDNGKFIFTVTNNSGTQPLFIFSDYLYEQLGFNKNSTNTFTTNVLNSTNVINLQLESTLFLHSDLCIDRGNDILHNIIVSGNSDYSNVVYFNNNVDIYSKKINHNNSNVYYFRLTNEDNELINLNGLNIVFTIMLYKSNQINDLIKGYIKYKTLENIN
jgi:hypothetical protein